MPGPVRFPKALGRFLPRLLTAVAITVVAGAVVVASLSGISPRPEGISAADELHSEELFGTHELSVSNLADKREPDFEHPLRQIGALRTVPVLADEGLLAHADNWWEDSSLIEDSADQIANEVGFGKEMPRLWAAIRAEEEAIAQGDRSKKFPYAYRAVDAVLNPVLTDQIVSEHRDNLRDLAGLMMLLATRDDTVSGNAAAGSAAYAILDTLRKKQDDCDTALTFAVLVGLGQFPQSRVVDRLFQRAIEACPGDPTPKWHWGLNMMSVSTEQAFEHLRDFTGLSRSDLLDRPVRYFAKWQRAEAGSSLAFAGEAEALVTQAEAMNDAGTMPFTARAHARRALALFENANRLERNVTFIAGRSRALSVLGLHGDAARLAATVSEQSPGNDDYRAFQVEMLDRAGKYKSAADQLRSPLTIQRDRFALVPRMMQAGRRLTLGTVGAVPSTLMDPTYAPIGAGNVVWLGFIPTFRGDLLEGSPWCRSVARARLFYLAKRYEDSASVNGTDVGGCLDGGDFDDGSSRSDYYLRMFDAAANDALGRWDERDSAMVGEDDMTSISLNGVSGLFDVQQDLWRSAGQFRRARDLTQRWIRESSRDPLALQRHGEVAYLSKSYRTAANAFAEAAKAKVVSPAKAGWNGLDRAYVRLQLGVALEELDDFDGAHRAYEAVVNDRTPLAAGDGTSYTSVTSMEMPLVKAVAQARSAGLATKRGDLNRSVALLTQASKAIENLECGDRSDTDWDPLYECNLTNGAEANNLAVALLDRNDRGDPDRAVSAARAAVRHDPLSPIYLETYSQSLQNAGDQEGATKLQREANQLRAVKIARRVLIEDETLHQSWNNYGVLEAGRGEWEKATRAFRRAIALDPTYARAWFNFGVALNNSGRIRDFLSSQQALARAIRLDGTFRGADLTLQSDTTSFATGVDVSRAIPADLKVGDVRSSPEQTWSWVVLVLMFFRLAIAFGVDKVGEFVGTRTLKSDSYRRRALRRVWLQLNRFLPLAMALAATTAIVSWLLFQALGFWIPFLAAVTVMVSTTWLYVVVPRVRRSSTAIDHRGWLPGIAFGSVSGIIGYPFVPAPVNVDQSASRYPRWSGAILLAMLTGIFLIVGFITGSPFARTVGITTLVMLATALFPIRPFDGGYARSRRVEIATSLALMGLSSALVLNWV